MHPVKADVKTAQGRFGLLLLFGPRSADRTELFVVVTRHRNLALAWRSLADRSSGGFDKVTSLIAVNVTIGRND